MGEAPDWWPSFEAAAECGSQPWIVAGMPETVGHHWWVEWALIRKAALADAQEELARKRAARQPRRR